MNILIVDEDQATSKGLGLALKKYFENITITNSPVTAKKFIKEKDFTLIISEINFSTENGFDVVKAFKSMSPTSIIIVISAHVNSKTQFELEKLGVTFLFEKPVNTEILRHEISKLTNYQAQRKE
jgi:DNA-binding NtrC family response regulator